MVAVEYYDNSNNMNIDSDARCYDVVIDAAKAMRLQGTLLELGCS